MPSVNRSRPVPYGKEKMTATAVTAITDLILAAETLFLAGRMTAIPKARFSAAWFWSGTLLLLGVAALIGGIDHGFFELSDLPRHWIERPNWMVLAAMTFCVLMTAAAQFFSPRTRRIVLLLGFVQFAADTIAIMSIDSFLVVILNYAPIMTLLLTMNLFGLKNGTGSRQMIVGILVMFAAAAIQSSRVDTLSPLDHNGLYHLASMIGVAFLYHGGGQLKR